MEESYSSIISDSLSSSSMMISETTRISNQYKLCTKLFLNKRFNKAYGIIEELYGDSYKLAGDEKIELKLFENVAKLYLTNLSLVISANDQLNIVSKKHVPGIVEKFREGKLLEQFVSVWDGARNVPLEIMYNYYLIVFTNHLGSLEELKKEVVVYISSIGIDLHGQFTDNEKGYFTRFLQLYLLNILPKLKQNDVAEEYIMTSPYIENKSGWMTHLAESVSNLKEIEANKAKLEKQAREKEEKVARQKEQELRKEQEEADLHAKLLKQAKEQAVLSNSLKEQKQQKKSTSMERYAYDYVKSLLVNFKDVEFLKRNSGFILGFLIMIAMIRRYLTGRRRGDLLVMLGMVGTRLKNTLSMALKVSYL